MIATEINELDGLLRDISAPSDTKLGLMREHLAEAKFYLEGGMPVEYRFNLDLAENLLPLIEKSEIRHRVADFLQRARL